MLRLVDEKWVEEFSEALYSDSSELHIICPFIKAGALKHILRSKPGNLRVITRFDLNDFAQGVSDIAALRMFLNADARVRGVRNLHAKLYIFGTSRAIITSANLTEAAMKRNHEFGTVVTGAAQVEKCRDYFDNLWERAGNDLTLEQVKGWDAKVTRYQLQGGLSGNVAGLEDLGAEANLPKSPPAQVPQAIAEASQAFVKFQGSSKARLSASEPTLKEIESSGCHWAVCYPAKRRPRSVSDNAVIFIGMFTRDPYDIRIFGRATGMAYKEIRDDATAADKERREWKNEYPHYIRVHDAEFVDGPMANGVSLGELMEALGEESFASTKRNAARGEGNTDPKKAYRQQPAVELSPEGLMWLNEHLQSALESHGKVPRARLSALDWPDLSEIPLIEYDA
ncbi:MAG: phospholipase D family protein [Chloroflexi bacterium]|nr:phospholipase D family protein [Chloroflexota bacterium]